MTEPKPRESTGRSHRPIRSFVRREGRMTEAQKRALVELWPRYGVELSNTALDLPELFGRPAPTVLEIGFGNGDALLQTASAHPEQDYLGIEVHRPGVGRLLQGLAAADLNNVRVVCADAQQVLQHHLAPASLDAVLIFFPDPWPKKRHHKRRLVQPDFVALTRTRLKPGGRLHLATDWEEYAQHMMDVLSQDEGLHNLAGPRVFAPRPGYRPLTKFERRGETLGHTVFDLIFERVK